MDSTMATTILIAALMVNAAAQLTAPQHPGCVGCLPNKCIILHGDVPSCLQCEKKYTLQLQENRGRVCISAPQMAALGNEDGPDELAPETVTIVLHSAPTAVEAPAAEGPPAEAKTQTQTADEPASEASPAEPMADAPATENPAAPAMPEPAPVPEDTTPDSGSSDEGDAPENPPLAETPSEPETVDSTPSVVDEPEMSPDSTMEPSDDDSSSPAEAPESEIYKELDAVSPVGEDPIIIIEFNE